MQTPGLLAFLCIVMGTTTALAQEPVPLPVYVVHRAASPILIDGIPDEAAWSAAETVRLRNSRTGEYPVLPTTFRCLWDDDYLYITFHSEDTDIWATMTVHDSEIWREEVVEVFIDADSDLRGYGELQVNPLGIPVDLWILHDTERQFHRGMREFNYRDYQSGVSVDGTVNDASDTDTSWDAELAIPFAEMVTAPHIPPEPGDSWKINFYRLERPRGQEEDLIALAWSPCYGSNHMPRRFGTIIFSRD